MMLYGLKVTLLGMGTVFVALYILMLLIQLQSNFLAPKPQKKQDEPKKEVTPAQAQVSSAQVTEKEDEDEIAAVIAAAIAACGQQVVIRTITRVIGTSGATWAQSGRTEAMNLRQV
jgi:sodium pump decarboxylase gamma subunit